MLGNDENPHYVMFFVNVPENRTEATQPGAVRYDPTGENRISSENASTVLGLAVTGAISALGAIKIGEGIASAISGDLVKATTQATQGAGAVAASPVIGAGVGLASRVLLQPKGLVHLPIAIALQIVDKPSATYSMGYEDKELGMLGAMSRGLDAGRGVIGEATDMGKALTREGILGAANIPKLAGLGFDFKSFVNKTERRVQNPNKEQMFKSAGFRSFTFEYTFMPRSEQELIDIKEIIDTFKRYMHPETSSNVFYLTYPAEFNIIYYYKDAENEYLHKVSACALKDLKVNYGGSDFTVFRNSKGKPTEIFLSLTFIEMEVLTSQRIDKGF